MTSSASSSSSSATPAAPPPVSSSSSSPLVSLLHLLEFDTVVTMDADGGDAQMNECTCAPWTIGQRVRVKESDVGDGDDDDDDDDDNTGVSQSPHHLKGTIKCYHADRSEVHVWFDDGIVIQNIPISSVEFLHNPHWLPLGVEFLPPDDSNWHPPRWAQTIGTCVSYQWRLATNPNQREYYAFIVGFDAFSKRSLLYCGAENVHQWVWVSGDGDGNGFKRISEKEVAEKRAAGKFDLDINEWDPRSCDCCANGDCYAPFDPTDYHLSHQFISRGLRGAFCMRGMNPSVGKKKKNGRDGDGGGGDGDDSDAFQFDFDHPRYQNTNSYQKRII